ncbi:MAG: energy transducer TonB [Prevotella sp.]|nr:energy transducer TonB [Prevotella sp.]MBR1840346.1 energy transducer TonB [Prevotella sp.]
MKKIVSILAMLLCMAAVQAQNDSASSETKVDSGGKDRIWDCAVEQMPSFPGGMGALMKYLADSVRIPKEAEDMCFQGRVICTFVVKKNGTITNVKVKRGIDPLLDAEAVRVIQNMPRWIPGKRYGKPYDVNFMLPISFKIR